MRTILIILLCIILFGCSNKSQTIDPEILAQGEYFAQELYKVTNDIDTYKNIDSDKLSEFYNQDETYLNTDEEKFINVIERMFVDSTAYYASYYAKEKKFNKEIKSKLKEHKRILENEYGINVD